MSAGSPAAHKLASGQFVTRSSSFVLFQAPVAQAIERRASNAEVAGESPAGSASAFGAIANRRSPMARGTDWVTRLSPLGFLRLSIGYSRSRAPR